MNTNYDLPTIPWAELYEKAKTDTSWNYANEWWNTKYYKKSNNTNGTIIHADIKKNKEIPFERNLFAIRNGRFSLKKTPIAYFASDLLTAIVETTKIFKNKPDLSYKDIEPYLAGLHNPTLGRRGNPIRVQIKEAIILDVSHPDCPFYVLTNKRLYKLLTDRDEDKSYEISQKIAAQAYENGFHGIAYRSSRTLSDKTGPYTCIVIFDKEKIHLHE